MLFSKLFCNNGDFLLFYTIKRFSHQTHYEILKLSRDCTKNDIRKSFIALSKEYHPDKHNGKDANDKFVQILEAYKILIRPRTRAEYDLGLSNIDNVNREIKYYKRPTPYDDPVAKAWKDPSFYQNRNKADDKYYQNHTKKWTYITCFSFISLALTIYGFTLWRIYFLHIERQNETKNMFKNGLFDSPFEK